MLRVLYWLLCHILLVLAIRDSELGDIRPGVFQLDAPMYDHLASEVEPIVESRNRGDFLLPTTTKPHHYDLWIKTRIDEAIYDIEGKIGIVIEALESTDKIVLHARELDIKSVKLFEEDRHTVVENTGFVLTNDDYGFFTIDLLEMLAPQRFYYLEIEWTSVLRSETVYNGFYRSRYVDGNGEVVWIATTKFEPVWARFAFPCYDEPRLKATFSINIEHGCRYHAISNMPESRTILSDGRCETAFEESHKMSTYLVVFIISDYEYVSNYEGPIVASRKLHRVYRPRDNYEDATELALVGGEDMIDFMEEYFGHEYPLPKLYQIGILQASGAMENWGLVTYIPSMLFWDPNTQAPHQSLSPLGTVTHELTHQWFGDLVSPEQWGYLWLNEGFATIFGYYLIDLVYEDKMNFDNRRSSCANVKVGDALRSTHAMSTYPSSPGEISNLFDNISYDKAGCVIYMMLRAITEDRFKKAMSIYMHNRAFQESNPDYLGEALHEAAHQEPAVINADYDFKEILDSWHTQAGVPVIHVDYNRETGTINLTQERYVTQEIPGSENTLWWIPYNFITASEINNPEFQYTSADDWLHERSKILTPTEARNWADEEWILFNKEQTGYYRVQYDRDNWEALSEALKSENAGNIESRSRAALIEDSFEFAINGHLSFDIPLNLAQYTSVYNEQNPFVWIQLFNKLLTIERKFVATNLYDKWMKYIRKITEKPFDSVKIDIQPDEPIYTYYLRANLINWACKSGNEKCLETTADAVKAHYDGTKVQEQYQLNLLQIYGIRKVEVETYYKIWNTLTTAPTSERDTIINGLSNTEHPELVEKLLQSAIDPVGTQIEDYLINYDEYDRGRILVAIVTYQPNGFDLVTEFLTTNVDAAFSLFSKRFNSIFDTLEFNTKTTDKRAKLSELIDLFTSKGFVFDTDYLQNVDNALEWLETTGIELDNWLDDNGYGEPEQTTTQKPEETTTTTTTKEPTNTTPTTTEGTEGTTTTTQEPDGAQSICVSIALLVGSICVTLLKFN